MAIFDILKVIARKAREGRALSESERGIVRSTTMDDLAQAKERGSLNDDDIKALTQTREQEAPELERATERTEVREEEVDEATLESRPVRDVNELSDAEREFEAERQTPPPRGGGPRRTSAAAGTAAGAGAAGEEAEAEIKEPDELREQSRTVTPEIDMSREGTVSNEEFEAAENQEQPLTPVPSQFANDAAFRTSFLRLSRGEDDNDQVVNTFLRTRSELQAGRIPPEVTRMREIIEEEEAELDRMVTRDALLSEEIPDEEKQEIAEGLRALREAGRPSSRTIAEKFTDEAAAVEDEVTPTGSKIQTERLRSSSEIRATNREIGALLSTTAEAADEEDSVLDDIRDFVEIVTPFVEQTDLAQIANESGVLDFGPVDFVLMGSFKRRVGDALVNIPDPELRLQAARKLISAARKKSGATPWTENELAAIVELESALRPGGPTDTEVLIDNIISVLDIVGVGQLVRRFAPVEMLRRATRVGPKARKVGPRVEEPELRPEAEGPQGALPPPALPEPPRKPRFTFRGVDERTGKPRWKLRLDEVMGTPRGTPMDDATRANPSVGGRLGAAAVADDTGNFADALGTTREDIVFDISPKPFDYPIDGATPRITTFLERVNRIEEIGFQETETLGQMFSEAERVMRREAFFNHYEDIGGLKLHTGKSQTRFNDEGAEIRGVFGPNDEHGFARFEDAESTRAFKFGKDDPDSSILFHDVRTGNVRQVNRQEAEQIVQEERERQRATGEFRPERGQEPPGPPGEFFVRKDLRQPFDAMKFSLFRENPVETNLPARLSIGIQDASSRFANFVRMGAFTPAENAANIERQILRELARIWPSSERTKTRLTEALMKGDEEQAVFSPRELHSRFGLDQNGIDAYLAYRRVMDVVWNLQNRDFRRAMLDSGFDRMLTSPEFGEAPVKVFDHGGDAVNEVNRVLRDLDANDFDAVNAVTGDPVRMSPDEVARAYEANEGHLARLFQRSYTDRGVDEYVWIPASTKEEAQVSIRALPSHVLPHREGHVPRFYNANWFVDRVVKNPRVNGRRPPQSDIDAGKFRQALGASESRRGAERMKERLLREAEEAGDLDKYEFRVRPDRARNRSRAERTARDMEIMTARRLTGQRRRGEVLRQAPDSPETDYINAEVEDPWAAMMRVLKATTRHVSMARSREVNRQRFLANYGDITGGRIPDSASEIETLARERGIDNPRRVADAINFRQYIEFLDRMPGSVGFDKNWHDMWYNIADRIESTRGIPEVTGKGVRSLGNLQLTQKTKSTAFGLYLALNPQRQFFLQMSQLAILGAIEPRYIYSGKLHVDLMALLLGAQARGFGGNVAREANVVAAKMMGESVEDYERILSMLVDHSGLPYNVDQHLLVNAFTDPYSAGKALDKRWWVRSPQQAGRAAQRGIQFGKSIGFDPGELATVMGSWLIALRRFRRNNPDAPFDSLQNRRQTQLEGRELSLAMTRPGAFIWQDGAISALMQFQSVPIKALLMGTSSNVLSRAEKARYWANAIIMFGPFHIPIIGGILAAAYESLLDEPPPKQVQRGLEGGIVDIAINTAADMAFNERNANDMLVAHDFSPIGQTADNYTRLWESTDRSTGRFLVEAVPGFSAASRIYDSFANIMRVFEAREAGQINNPETIKRVFKALASAPSGMSNYYRMQAALAMNRAVSRSGDIGVEQARGEAYGKLFGIQSADERDYWETIKGSFDRKEDIRKDARNLYDFWKQQEILFGSGTLNERALESAYQTLEGMMSVYPPEDRDLLYQEFQRLNGFDRENGRNHVYGLILDRLARTRGAGGMEGLDGLKGEVNASRVLTPKMKEDINSLIDQGFNMPEEGNVNPEEVE